VTDETGAPRSVETETSSDGDEEFLLVKSVTDEYVHGAQTYVFRYHQQNVILFPDNASGEEFFWQVNGTGWNQPFGTVSASIVVADQLRSHLTGQVACFQGSTDSTTPCDTLSADGAEETGQIDAAAQNLDPHEGLAVDLGFAPGTFTPRDDSFTANAWPALSLAGALLTLGTLITALIFRRGRWRSQPGRPVIIAEYLPPKGVNLLTAADVSGVTGTGMAALFLSLAVRGNLRVLDTGVKKRYLLELVSTAGADPNEQAVLQTLFPSLAPGSTRDLGKKSASLSTALQSHLSAARKQVIVQGLRAKAGGAAQGWLLTLAILGGLLGVFAGISALATEVAAGWPALFLGLALAASITTIGLAASVRPLTSDGAELRDYLKGVKLYIRFAEVDRMRVLQSPDGVLRSPYRPDAVAAGVTEGGSIAVLKLYERLLPFAVLFGQEKEWSRVLGEYYAREGSAPGWYGGSGAFNAALFATGISSFASLTTAAWSGSASSSSSSGFSGGGSVGGGGGGGGGGGA
jgi:uncharacterized membrane protein YgcG